MAGITTGVGLASGIDSASLIEQLIAIESITKLRLQSRVERVQAERTAMLDINARLLNLRTSAGAFRSNDVFDKTTALTSDETLLTASTSSNAQPGSYSFIVKQLVTTASSMTSGFSDRDTTPLGLTGLSFELGQGRLSGSREVSQLNGGNGIDRGYIEITDRSGTEATIDLTDVVTLDEVVTRINAESELGVVASIDENTLVLTDTTGSTDVQMTVAEVGGGTTAASLGIDKSTTGVETVITGDSIYYMGNDTPVSALNDGRGVLIRQGVADLVITDRAGDTYNIDLGRIDLPIDDDTLLAELNDGDGVTINDDNDEADLLITIDNGSETEYEINLTGVTTVGELRARITSETSGDVTLNVNADGDGFTVVNNVGGTMTIEGTGPNNDATAEDLGIFEDTAFAGDLDGDSIPNTVEDSTVRTLQDIVDRINNAIDESEVDNGGRIVASIAADGVSLQIDDTTGGAGDLTILGAVGMNDASDPYEGGAAADLGIYTSATPSNPDPNQVAGTRIFGSLNSVLINSINGGGGLNGQNEITITDRNGAALTISNLDSYGTLEELMDGVNQDLTDNLVDVQLSLNSAGTGLLVTDTSGGTGNLIVTGLGADELQISTDVAGVASASVAGGNLQRRYVDEATRLEDLNYGQGVETGSFKITDGFGQTATVSVGNDASTLYDIIAEINSKGLAIEARINDNGDGLIIEQDQSGTEPYVALKIEAVSGTTASDLNILGTAGSVTGADAIIDGSYEYTIDVDAGDSLDDVMFAIRESGAPVNATVINTGEGNAPFRLSLTSGISGSAGDLVINTEGADLGLSTIETGKDARIFFGSADPETAVLLTSGTNTFENVIDGVEINAVKASTDVVTLNIARDVEGIKSSVGSFVAAMNDVLGRIDQYDFFNTESEERGVLLGNANTARLRAAIFTTLRQRAQSIDTQYQFLAQVGFGVNSDGQVTWDQGKFDAAYENDPEGVENLFTAFESSVSSETEIAPGITIVESETTFESLGFGDIFKNLADDYTNSIDGVLTLADDAFESRIDLLNDQIELQDERLEAKREQLQRQFAAMELAISDLQGQSASLQTLSSIAANSASFF